MICVVRRFSASSAMNYTEPEKPAPIVAPALHIKREEPKPKRYTYAKEITAGKEDPEYRKVHDRATFVVPSMESLLYTRPFSDSVLLSIQRQHVERVASVSGTVHRVSPREASTEPPKPTQWMGC